MKKTETISQGLFVDLVSLFKSIEEVEAGQKMSTFLKNSGVKFYDQENTFVQQPKVGIVGIGGLSVKISESENSVAFHNLPGNALLKESDFANLFSPMQAAGGFMSYLNSGNTTVEKMTEVLLKYGHFSTLHMTYVNIGIFGISCAVENEFNTQRDVVHISRITEARTSVQTRPPVVVLFPEFLEDYKKVYSQSLIVREALEKSASRDKKDFLEAANLLYPAAKATAIVISGTIRNLKKLMSGLDDVGKEDEYRRTLWYTNNTLHQLWPAFFKASEDYSYKLPQHLK